MRAHDSAASYITKKNAALLNATIDLQMHEIQI